MPDAPTPTLRIGIDVGGTFTDCVAWDGRTLRTAKLPSTPPDYHLAVLEGIRHLAGDQPARIIHGSTVATNALLQRKGAPIAFVTTEGFRDMLLIARHNRPSLYALHVKRPPPITPGENCFTLAERISATGHIVTPLNDAEVHALAATLRGRNLHHVALCLLFSFINPAHEHRAAAILRRHGLTVTPSADLLPEFREYERASTTAINASLRPTIESYLATLQSQLPPTQSIEILHSSGGTLAVRKASEHAARLVLSGPAGGVLAASLISRLSSHPNLITYDMGGTSTDVATLQNHTPAWTTATTIDHLPLALPMFDIHTVGAGGGSIAYLDPGHALRVGPRSAGALPGPACYNRGGTEPTVTDANLLLGRLLPDAFLNGQMPLHKNLAEQAVGGLARQMNKSIVETSLGILQIAEANMAAAVRHVTSRRGHDPRDFALISFGGAGGLHAAPIAESLDIPAVLIPPHPGLLSALGMLTAPTLHDASQTVLHLPLTDDTLNAAYATLFSHLPRLEGATDERFADLRFTGQSHELKIPLDTQCPPPADIVVRASSLHAAQPHPPFDAQSRSSPRSEPDRPRSGLLPALTMQDLHTRFRSEYTRLYGPPPDRPIQTVTLRVRRTLPAPPLTLPPLSPNLQSQIPNRKSDVALIDPTGHPTEVPTLTRPHLLKTPRPGPFLLLDPDATTFVPAHWTATADPRGIVTLTRPSRKPRA